jgi:hypothetical protein
MLELFKRWFTKPASSQGSRLFWLARIERQREHYYND